MATLIEILPELNLNVSLTVLLLALLGLLLLLSGIRRCWHRHLLSGSLTGSLGITLLCLSALVFAIALNLHTYYRLTYEKPIARLYFEQQAATEFRTTITYLDDRHTEEYWLHGDEWQLDARILRWHPPFQLLGLNSLFRLERLSGRYANIEQERSAPRTVYALGQPQGLDIWSIAREYERWLKWMDAYYGSATYLPMRDGAKYDVFINQYGLMARPANMAADEAAGTWD